MQLPVTQTDLLQRVIAETARMSYPGSMSRGAKPVVSKGTKVALEKHLLEKFPIGEVWSFAGSIAPRYENWHLAQVREIAHAIGPNVAAHNLPMSVAAKFMNTFMHQLMKYAEARPLFQVLHLPLDARVFGKLAQIGSPALGRVKMLLKSSPYALEYESHIRIQEALSGFVEELNARPNAGFVVRSRIELNWLWL